MNIKSRVVDFGISDHKGLVIEFGKNNNRQRKQNIKRIKVDVWKFSPDILNFARNNKPIVSVGNDANSAALALTEWFQEMNSLAVSTKSLTTGRSEVPKWFTQDLQLLKEEFQNNKTPGFIRNQARNRYVKEVRKAKKKFV